MPLYDRFKVVLMSFLGVVMFLRSPYCRSEVVFKVVSE